MKKIIVLLIILNALSFSLSASNCYALVIGNGNYEGVYLRNPIKEETNNKQITWDSSCLTDNFIFAMSCTPKPKEPKQEIEVETEYPYGQIKVESNAEGSVYVDNEYVCSIIANSVKTLKNIRTGSHIVKVKTDNETKTEYVTVQKNSTSSVSFYYTPNIVSDGNLIFVQGGTFQMGTDDGESDEKPIHRVTVSDFYIGKYEVTNREFIEFLNTKKVSSNGSYSGNEYIDMDNEDCAIGYRNGKFYFKGSKYANDLDCPVIAVTWFGADTYCKWKGGRLPTEAEWEYAARGGNRSEECAFSGSNNIGDVAWYKDNPGSEAQKVGMKHPNELGIYDMSGNVWEWCSDWYDKNYYSKSSTNNPTGPGSGSYHSLRGGGWTDFEYHCRVAFRGDGSPNSSNVDIGFRLVRAP